VTLMPCKAGKKEDWCQISVVPQMLYLLISSLRIIFCFIFRCVVENLHDSNVMVGRSVDLIDFYSPRNGV
jgi:hypothetical protein